jgi:hypothetical protein
MASHIERRKFLATLGGAVAWPLAAQATGTRFQFVPYRGAAPMIQDLVAGQIDLTFTQVASAPAQVRAGQLKAYGVMAKGRWPAILISVMIATTADGHRRCAPRSSGETKARLGGCVCRTNRRNILQRARGGR